MKRFLYTFAFCAASLNVSAQSFPTLSTDNSEIGMQIQRLNLESAMKTINTQLQTAKRKKQSTALLDSQLEACETCMTALKGTNKIAIIDSVVIDKSAFLSAYKVTPELGKISLSTDGELASFTPERGYFTYRAERNPSDSMIVVKKYIIENGVATTPSSLNGIDADADINYPFLMADGTTFYFASRSDEGLGNYDIYVTRYDTEEDHFLHPTNLGYPFNSYANDYMMVVDEQNGVGWFASDRYQPTDKVCVYTFIYSNTRHTYDWETDSHAAIASAAKIHAIRDTWKNVPEDQLRAVRQNLVRLSSQADVQQNYEFTFVINDLYTYHYASDFKKLAALTEYKKYASLLHEQEEIASQLDNLRSRYRNASATAKDAIRTTILQLEEKQIALTSSISKSAKQVRKLELQ